MATNRPAGDQPMVKHPRRLLTLRSLRGLRFRAQYAQNILLRTHRSIC